MAKGNKMNIATMLRFKYPGSDSMRDWEVRDDSDGKGQYIATWNLPNPQPTKAELQAVWDSPEFQAWYKERRAEAIDIGTAQAIRKSIHPHVPVDEEFAIHRELLEEIIAHLGIEFPKRFQVLSDTAEAEIAKGRKKKDALKE